MVVIVMYIGQSVMFVLCSSGGILEKNEKKKFVTG